MSEATLTLRTLDNLSLWNSPRSYEVRENNDAAVEPDFSSHQDDLTGRNMKGIAFQNTLVGSVVREQAFSRELSKIESYRFLERGFDHYGGLPASERTIEFGKGLVHALAEAYLHIPPPTITPISTGMFISWKEADRELYFEVEDDSVLSVYRVKDAVVECDEDASFDVRAAQQLVLRFHKCA